VAATLWIPVHERARRASHGFSHEVSVPWPEPGRYGRNSNLRRLQEIANDPLFRVKVGSPAEAVKLIRALGEGPGEDPQP